MLKIKYLFTVILFSSAFLSSNANSENLKIVGLKIGDSTDEVFYRLGKPIEINRKIDGSKENIFIKEDSLFNIQENRNKIINIMCVDASSNKSCAYELIKVLKKNNVNYYEKDENIIEKIIGEPSDKLIKGNNKYVFYKNINTYIKYNNQEISSFMLGKYKYELDYFENLNLRMTSKINQIESKRNFDLSKIKKENQNRINYESIKEKEEISIQIYNESDSFLDLKIGQGISEVIDKYGSLRKLPSIVNYDLSSVKYAYKIPIGIFSKSCDKSGYPKLICNNLSEDKIGNGDALIILDLNEKVRFIGYICEHSDSNRLFNTIGCKNNFDIQNLSDNYEKLCSTDGRRKYIVKKFKYFRTKENIEYDIYTYENKIIGISIRDIKYENDDFMSC